MKAVVLTKCGGPENLQPAEVDRYEGPLPAGFIRVKVAMAGISGSEVYARRGNRMITITENGVTKEVLYQAAGLGAPPYVAGKEGAGEVIETGPDVTRVKVGDRVAWTTAQIYQPYTGALAEECVLNQAAAFVIPPDIAWGDAIAMTSTGLTAHFLATDIYAFRPGDRAVITTAAGSIGTTLTQLLGLQGVKVTGVVSNEEKAEAARQAGCEHVIVGYDNYSEKVRALIGGSLERGERRFTLDTSGAAVAYDGLGAGWWKEAANSVRVRGTVVLYGHAISAPSEVSPMELLDKGSLSVIVPAAADYIFPAERGEARFAELCQWIREGRLKPVIGATVPMERASDAHALYDARAVGGKILISVP